MKELNLVICDTDYIYDNSSSGEVNSRKCYTKC